ncbi:MAG: hypothetical protein ABR961_08855 [Thermoanaerobaculaceae bacterium]|jgi:hypothetical protein
MSEKTVRRQLRELAAHAYEEELRQALAPLAAAFERWKVRAASSFEVSDLIHEFHQGPSRRIWGTYNALKPDALVARAVALGLLAPGSLPPEVATSLAQKIETFREIARDSD